MTDRYAVIGNPIAQSRSPWIHAAFARQCGQDLSYEALLAEPDAFESTVRAFMAAGGKGMNVTAPFKLDALALSDHLSDQARVAQAVNTLSFTARGIVGDNTDGVGLVNDIQERLEFPLADRRILVIGAGGAARGILLPLLQAAPAHILLVNRTPERASQLVAALGHPRGLEAGPLQAATGRPFDLVLQATSAGLLGQGAPAVDFVLSSDSLAYDLAYADQPTAFMRLAQARGAARVSDGLGMLVGQAAESFFIWRGVRPATGPVLDALKRPT